jgi:hypothetical protein
VIRFYLGNTRLLDDCYILQTHNSVGTHRHSVLAADYFVIAFIGVLFAALGFYVRSPFEFCVLFAAILSIDIVWLFATEQDAQEAPARRARRFWYCNNLIHLIPMIALLVHEGMMPVGRTTNWLLVVQGLMLTNTLVDFYISREFYFPRNSA